MNYIRILPGDKVTVEMFRMIYHAVELLIVINNRHPMRRYKMKVRPSVKPICENAKSLNA